MGHRVKCPRCGSRFWVHEGQHVAHCKRQYGGCGKYFNAHTNVAIETDGGFLEVADKCKEAGR